VTRSAIVTFTTDFGLKDTFVGEMKGAALSVHPGLTLVDLTHEVPAHDITAGAVYLKMGYRAFPPGTVHVAVVDPGVGTSRRGLAVRTEDHYFVAPDNGILSLVLRDEPAGEARVLEAGHYKRPSVSSTFEGRDVFAPVAAWIARGIKLENLGPPAGRLVDLNLPIARLERGRPSAVRVLLVDRFGNVMLNVSRRDLEPLFPGAEGAALEVRTPRGTVTDFRRTYRERESTDPFLLFNSADFLELAVLTGRASDRLALNPGDEVELTVRGAEDGLV
jgi:S-adenosylmethionine hydrolase